MPNNDSGTDLSMSTSHSCKIVIIFRKEMNAHQKLRQTYQQAGCGKMNGR